MSRELADALQARTRGPVLTDGDALYDERRIGFNAMYDRRPLAIARCTGVADIRAAVSFAVEHDLVVAVRGGGHSLPASSTTEGGLLIDLGPMQGVHVDPLRRTAQSQPGVTWGLFDRETQAYGLATTGGVISTTGVSGLTLGGGIGRLQREYGLSCDNVLSFDVVLADGRLVRASEDEEPELFWALRGGGGNFGIVTNFEFRLHPVPPLLLGGLVIWSGEHCDEITEAVQALMTDAPEQMSVQVVYVDAPEMPVLPTSVHHKPIIAASLCWTGDLVDGEEHFRPLRTRVAPLLDLVAPMPYTVLQGMNDVLAPFGRRSYLKTGFLSELSDDALTVINELNARRTSPFTLFEYVMMGGAIERVAPLDTAYPQRAAKICWNAIGAWTDPADDDTELAWCREFGDAMEPFNMPGRYINFLFENDDSSVRAAVGEELYGRLMLIKEQYDPGHVFSHNPNLVAVRR